jgi:hypothetical protein
MMNPDGADFVPLPRSASKLFESAGRARPDARLSCRNFAIPE